MGRKIQLRRGLKADLPTLDNGEVGFAQDTEELFIGSSSGNKKLTFDATKYTSYDAQLAENETKVNKNLAFPSSSAGVTNATASSGKLDFLKTTESNRLLIDSTTDFHLDDLFPSEMAKKVVKGNRNIKSAHGYNIYEKKTETSDIYYVGKINSGSSMFSKVFEKLKNNQEVKIVIVGDSISTAADYSSYRKMPGLAEANGPNTKTTINTWVYHFVHQLMSVFPNGKITVYDRSVGGNSFNQLQTVLNPATDNSYTLVGRENYNTSNTWYQNIKACTPDLTILSMGMNHLGDFYSSFITNFYNPAVADGFINTSDFAMLTTPNPAFTSPQGVGDFRQYTYNAYKIQMQILQKNLTNQFGWYCIDVGKLSTLYRYGIDFDSITLESSNTDTNVSARITNTGQTFQVDQLANVTPSTGELRLIADDYNFFGQHEWQLYFSSEFWSSADNRMYYYITPTCAIKILGNGTIYLEDALVQKSMAFQQDSAIIRVDVLPNSLQLWIDGIPSMVIPSPKYEDTNPTNYVWGFMGSGWNANVRLLNVKAPKYTKYNKVMSHDDMFNADLNPSNWIDGGVNHPRSLGVAHTYNVAVNEFVNDIKNSYAVFKRYAPLTGMAAPTTQPSFIGQEYLDTTNKRYYKAFGTTSSADWIVQN